MTFPDRTDFDDFFEFNKEELQKSFCEELRDEFNEYCFNEYEKSGWKDA